MLNQGYPDPFMQYVNCTSQLYSWHEFGIVYHYLKLSIKRKGTHLAQFILHEFTLALRDYRFCFLRTRKSFFIFFLGRAFYPLSFHWKSHCTQLSSGFCWHLPHISPGLWNMLLPANPPATCMCYFLNHRPEFWKIEVCSSLVLDFLLTSSQNMASERSWRSNILFRICCYNS